MKTKFTLLFLLAFGFFSTNAQILNGGLEDWSSTTPSTPDEWDTFDRLIQSVGGGTIPVKEWCVQETLAANVFAGTSAAKLTTDTTSAPIGLLPGALVNGSLNLSGGGVPTQNGWAFSSRPVTFNGAIKYLPNGTDTAIYQFVLTKWNVTGDSADLVGIVGVGVLNTSGGYVPFSDTVQYYSSETPDSLLIVFQSSLGSAGSKIGSTLWVDDLSVTDATVGIIHFDMDDAVKVYPNPATSFLTVSVDEYMTGYYFEVTDVKGSLIKTSILGSAVSTIDVSNLSNGTYIYRVADKAGNILKQDRFSIVK